MQSKLLFPVVLGAISDKITSIFELKYSTMLVLDFFSKNNLDKNGVVISKLFMGEDFEAIKIYAKKTFKKIHFFKPNSSRDESRETYIHCSGLST